MCYFLCIFSLLILYFLVIMFYCKGKKKRSPFLKSLNSAQATGDQLSGGGTNSLHSESPLKRKVRNLMDSITFFTSKVVGYIPSHHIRDFFYKYVFRIEMQKNCVIYYGLEIRDPWNVILGSGTIIGDHSMLDARYGIKIGCNVNFSTGVWIYTLQHDVDSPTFSTDGEGNPVIIGNRVWLSTRTIILPGCNIAEGVVLAAGAVATKSLTEAFSVYAGIPSKKIGERNRMLTYEFDGKGYRHFL